MPLIISTHEEHNPCVHISLAFSKQDISLFAWTPMDADADITCAEALDNILHGISCALMETIVKQQALEKIQESESIPELEPSDEGELLEQATPS